MCTIAEAIGRRDCLWLHMSSEDTHANPRGRVFCINDEEIAGLHNAASVRAPTTRQDGSVDSSRTELDLCEAIARMDSGEFKTLMIPQSVQDCAYKSHSDSFGPLLRELTGNARGPPKFYDPARRLELMAGFNERLDVPSVKPRLAVFCAGVGCDALAALAAGYEVVLLVDVCPHSVEILKLKFPDATVL